MTEQEFEAYYGMKPERCKKLLERFTRLINNEVHDVIEHCDFYINPTDYCQKEYLEDEIGGKLEKENEEADGYTCLYDSKRQYSAEGLFMKLISCDTYHGGYTSAMEACRLMDLKWSDDDE